MARWPPRPCWPSSNLYRGRVFIVYWIDSSLLLARSLTLLWRGYEDVRLGSVMLGVAQLCGVWAAGLTLLAGGAFPDAPLRWNAPLRVAAGTAVWFRAAPFVFPLTAVFSTGSAGMAALCGWASIRYLRRRRTRDVGPFLIGAGMALRSWPRRTLRARAWCCGLIRRQQSARLRYRHHGIRRARDTRPRF